MEQVKYKLKKLVNLLKKYRGRHTELVSVYVPSGFNLDLITTHVFQERGTASNIKSKTTRKNVMAALDKILQELKKVKRTPPNGLAVFCGNISEREGSSDIQMWIIEPPEPINIRLYRCDQAFVLEPLEKMLEAKTVYGLIVLDNKNAAIALLKGKYIDIKKEMKSSVPGKMRAGGQSAQRFQRVRENLKKEWYKKIAGLAKEYLKEVKNLKGIILGGPGPAKEEFMSMHHFQDLKNKVIAVLDIGYAGEEGIQELISKSEDILKKEEIMEEKRIMQGFFDKLGKDTKTVTYGEKQVKQVLEIGAVDALLLSETLSGKKIDEFEELAKKDNSKIHIISNDTKEGEMFAQMGGIGATLRYKIN